MESTAIRQQLTDKYRVLHYKVFGKMPKISELISQALEEKIAELEEEIGKNNENH